jgi:hypothetical protein
VTERAEYYKRPRPKALIDQVLGIRVKQKISSQGTSVANYARRSLLAINTDSCESISECSNLQSSTDFITLLHELFLICRKQ